MQTHSPKVLSSLLLLANQGTGKGPLPAQARETKLLSHRLTKLQKTLETPKSHLFI